MDHHEHRALEDAIAAKAKGDAAYAIAYALLRIAGAQAACATHLKYLGTGDAATTMGAIEFLGQCVKELAPSMHSIASAIQEHQAE